MRVRSRHVRNGFRVHIFFQLPPLPLAASSEGGRGQKGAPLKSAGTSPSVGRSVGWAIAMVSSAHAADFAFTIHLIPTQPPSGVIIVLGSSKILFIQETQV